MASCVQSILFNCDGMATELNSASLGELMDLPGVGRAIAQRIVAARPFTELSQLREVHGIGSKRYLALICECLVSIDDANLKDTTRDTAESKAREAARIRPSTEPRGSSLVDLNRASLEELTTLRGVGPVLAQRILDARPFRRKDEVTAVRGIGLITYAKMQHQLLDVRRSSSSSSHVEDSDDVHAEPTNGLDAQPTISLCNRDVELNSKSTTFHDSHCRNLVGDIRRAVLPRVSKKVLIASWNIRNLSKRRDAVPLHRIADILEEFDVIAMQEARDTIVLKRLKSFMSGWDYIASPPVGIYADSPQSKRRAEHFAFFYRRRVIAPVGLGRFDLSTVSSSASAVVRPPFIVSFQTICDQKPSIQFALVNVHVVCGDHCSRQREVQELRCLAARLKAQKLCDRRNWVLLGDFNLSPQDIGSIGDGDCQFEPLILSPLTTTVGGKLFDNIWISACGDWNDLVVESGVYRIDWAFYPQSNGAPRHLESTEARVRAQAARAQCSLELSDHCPVWLALGEQI